MPRAIILGGERGIRYLDTKKSYPLSLQELGEGKYVLDWILQAIAKQDISRDQIVFVGGYHLEKVVKLYPGIKYYFHSEWEKEGEAAALSVAKSELGEPCFVCSTRVVFRDQALAILRQSDADVAVGIIGTKNNKGLGYNPVGLAWFNANGVAVLRDFIANLQQKELGFESLLGLLAEQGLKLQALDISDHCAELRDELSLSQFVFGSKAKTLERLRPVLQKAIVLEQISFFVEEWRQNAKSILTKIQNTFSETIIVRSSANAEDSWVSSQAGRFSSILDVDSKNSQAVTAAVTTVIESFKSVDDEQMVGKNEVFVQPFLKDIDISGVVLTRDLETGSPYYLFTVDRQTGRTDTVTSGADSKLETFVISHRPQCQPKEPFIQSIIEVIGELKGLLGHDSLDIEFAFDRSGQCHLLQVRVLVGSKKDIPLADSDVEGEIASVREYVSELLNRRPHLYGERTILANMPDWNPAELIGVLPSPLALSLFQNLITDSIWGAARVPCGYKNTYPERLVVALAGHPFVDTRASLNSLLPETLGSKLSEKLVNHSLDWLEAHPEFHDKFEFEVALTCLDFDFNKHSIRLLENGFGREEVNHLQHVLRELTNDIILGNVATISQQIQLVNQLQKRRQLALKTNNGSLTAMVRTIDFLMGDCRELGTLPFSTLARYAFIATSFLRSLRAREVFSDGELALFLQSIPSIATQISKDLRRLSSGAIALDYFLKKYGHLRPGTYDITCPSYAEAPDFYFSDLNGANEASEQTPSLEEAMGLFETKHNKIKALIRQAGFSFTVQQLRDFIMSSIPARENTKFEYTKNLCAILSLIKQAGADLGFMPDDLQCLPIDRLLDVTRRSPSSVIKREFKSIIAVNKKHYSLHKGIKLPSIITSVNDIDCFKLPECLPNYITSKHVTAAVADVDRVEQATDLNGKIALIASADPGYDWLFGRGICGLVTKYGGVASHMAIRAAELSLPAAIGCGELIYDQVDNADMIDLDCMGQRIEVLR